MGLRNSLSGFSIHCARQTPRASVLAKPEEATCPRPPVSRTSGLADDLNPNGRTLRAARTVGDPIFGALRALRRMILWYTMHRAWRCNQSAPFGGRTPAAPLDRTGIPRANARRLSKFCVYPNPDRGFDDYARQPSSFPWPCGWVRVGRI